MIQKSQAKGSYSAVLAMFRVDGIERQVDVKGLWWEVVDKQNTPSSSKTTPLVRPIKRPEDARKSTGKKRKQRADTDVDRDSKPSLPSVAAPRACSETDAKAIDIFSNKVPVRTRMSYPARSHFYIR